MDRRQNFESRKITPIENFWENKEKGIPINELFSKKAEQTAKEIAKFGVSFNQIRNFYDNFLSIKTKLLLKKDFSLILPEVQKMVSKFAYANSRESTTHISRECKDFFTNCIEQIKDEKDFNVFIDFFESIIAYYKKNK